ncbi:MAG: hypothetical protein ABEJ22_01735 [Haloferacaceae archaeon]
MAIRPVDEDLLEEVCRSIALDNSGFLYVNKEKGEIQSRYENGDTGMLKAGSLSARDIKEELDSLAGDEFSEFERLRTGVYYFNPLDTGNDDEIAAELTNLFGQRLVVTSEELRSRFDVAFDDLDILVNELESKNLVRRIAAGERDYFTIGSRLKDRTGKAGVDARLRQKADHGKIQHDQLERVINVEATADVIRYLESQSFIVDLDGQYLVKSAIGQYADYLAGQVVDDVQSQFEKSKYVLPKNEYDRVVQNAIDDWSDVLTKAGTSSHEVLEKTKTALKERLDVEEHGAVYVQSEELDEFLDQRAKQLQSDVIAENDHISTEEGFKEAGAERIEEMQLVSAATANEYLTDELKSRYESLVEEDFTTA